MAYLGGIIRSLKNGMASMNESVNAVDRIQKAVPQSMLTEYEPNVHWNDEFPAEDNNGVSGMTWAQVMVNRTRESMRSGDGKLDDKFAPGFFRILLTECGFRDDHRKGEQKEKQRRLGGLYRLFIADPATDKDLMSYNFVPMVRTKSGPKTKDGAKAWTYEDFENVYGKTLDDRIADDRRRASEAVSADRGYKVIEIKDFKTAKKYGAFTGGRGGTSKLCYTQDENVMKDQFGGLVTNRVWLAYRPGFNRLEPIEGENNPYDEYGLSMIWVFVSSDGNMPYVNVRWNHANSKGYTRGEGTTDHCLSMADVVEITGHDFKTSFRPYYFKENRTIHCPINDRFNIVERSLTRKGINDDRFSYNICRSDEKNVDNAEFLLPEWVDIIDHRERNGFVKVELHDMNNLFNLESGKYVFDRFMDDIGTPRNGTIRVWNGEKQNICSDRTGEILLPQWVDCIYYIAGSDGLVKVSMEGKENMFDPNSGKYILTEWVDGIDYKGGRTARVKKDNRWEELEIPSANKTESRRRHCAHRVCECCGRRIHRRK